jgi:polysaccharide biosynthesis protein PslA
MFNDRSRSADHLLFSSGAFALDAAYGVSIRRTPALVAPDSQDGRGVALKRVFDVVAALLALVFFAPAMLAIALLIRLETPGAAVFRQRRVGLTGQPFEMLKFRTMHATQARTGHGSTECHQARRGDPRVTRFGAWLRCSSFDELPQLINVLRGEMSVVGPRPHAPGTRAGGRLFEDVSPRYAARHQIRPGMTGLAQVRGFRGETDTEDKLLRRLDADLEYIRTRSFCLDLRIVWRTIGAVFHMHNAY